MRNLEPPFSWTQSEVGVRVELCVRDERIGDSVGLGN